MVTSERYATIADVTAGARLVRRRSLAELKRARSL
jgi:hypothetical protein